VLVPELRRAVEAGGGLRTLYLIEDLEEIEPGALWADSKQGFDLRVRHHEAWVARRSSHRHQLDGARDQVVCLDGPW
jgi:hypothetical protein